MDTAGFMVWVIFYDALKREERSIYNQNSVAGTATHFSVRGYQMWALYTRLRFFRHWCKSCQAPLDEKGASAAVFTFNDFRGFSVKWLCIFPIVRLPCEKQSQGHRIILIMNSIARIGLGPTWGSKLPFKRVSSIVSSPGDTVPGNAGEETHLLSRWSCWYFSSFSPLHKGVSTDCSKQHTRLANPPVNSHMRKTKFHIPLLMMKARTGS